MNPWERYVVPNLVGCACSARPIMKQREKIVPLAQGDVLELGCGSGTNFAMYDGNQVDTLYALEPSPGMLKKSRREASKLGIGAGIEFIQAGAEAIPLDDDSIDTAVITFVLCNIPDWQGALREVRRILKPGGKILYSEHGRSPDEGVAKWQRRVEPVWKPLGGGCHLTRNVTDMFEGAGFKLEETETMYLPNTPRVVGYCTWGQAHPA